MVMVCSGYSRWIATLIPFSVIGSLERDLAGDSATILHSTGIMMLLCNVTTPSCTGSLSIPFYNGGSKIDMPELTSKPVLYTLRSQSLVITEVGYQGYSY
ncbi:hypothetical protein Tco_0840369 [Tanacetum coccineum]|uniref:Uncharacterized protein n=1 Tax=Tanacetum coccineum TaxID=301880 RepID=A0ABQ5AWC4_9ASTR